MSSGTGVPGEQPSELAELLEELKQRSGRSYSAIAHRTGLGRSTVHRYCQGTTVPTSFGVVESLARVCGASPGERDRLYRAWARAAGGAGAGEAGETGEAAPGSVRPADTPRPGASGAPGSSPLAPVALRLRVLLWLRPLALALAFVLTSIVATTASGIDPVRAPQPGGGAGAVADGEQQPRGPEWYVSPRDVPAAYFGLTVNTDTGDMPSFRTGSVRLWETGTRWGAIEKRRKKYDWSVLDRMVAAAERKRLPVLFTFGGTPLWAAEDGVRSGYADSLASPPDDLKDWDRFVGEVVERYRGRIEAYELWDYASHRLHYAGSTETLAEMVERAARIIRRTDPAALAVCPSFGDLWTAGGVRKLREFVRTDAFERCDALALKLSLRRSNSQPEELIPLARKVQRLLYHEGRSDVHLWNTGPDRQLIHTGQLNSREARDHAARFYLAGLYARHHGVRRMYFYSWGSTTVPLVVEPVGGSPTDAGNRMGRLRDWLDGARITACGQGTRMGLPKHAYTCRFTRRGEWFQVRWTTRGTAQFPAGKGAFRIRHMDGTAQPVREGERVSFGEEPVMVEYRKG